MSWLLTLGLLGGCARNLPPRVASLPTPPPPPTAVPPVVVGWSLSTPLVLEVSRQPDFVKDTNIILPESSDVLDALADYLHVNAEIVLLKIVGFDSCPSPEHFGYRLPETRARAVYEALMTRGVPKQRLAYSAWDELGPDHEPCVQEIRFQTKQVPANEAITTTCEPGKPVVDCYPKEQRLPWNGQIVDVVIPTLSRP